MGRYVLHRLLAAIPTLAFVIVLAFLLVRAAPGGPFDEERVLPAEIERNIEAYYGLDRPLSEQFLNYVGGLLQGDLGPSYRYRGQDVNDLIAATFPNSFRIGALALGIALLFGIGAGTWAALAQGSVTDRLLMGVAMTGISVPIFVVAPLLVLLFAVWAGWLPAGWSSTDSPVRYVLPVTALALPQLAYIARLTRASMLDALASSWARTARAQGLGTFAIVRHHALRPAMRPVVSWLGPAAAAILTGSVVVEEIFGIPGLGRQFVQGALNRDYTLVMGVVIFYATLIIVFNLLVDLLYAALDPRVRYR